jgi:hypothetical protein
MSLFLKIILGKINGECQKEDWEYSIYSSKSELWVFSKDLVMIRF